MVNRERPLQMVDMRLRCLVMLQTGHEASIQVGNIASLLRIFANSSRVSNRSDVMYHIIFRLSISRINDRTL
jgi:hypothetical protein